MAAPTDPAAKVAAVVYNPIKVDLPKLKKAVNGAASAAGWGTTIWLSTSEKDAGQGATKRAVAGGAIVVIAAGGDGTVRAVAEALRDSDVALSLLPSGTGNLLARNLDLPLTNIDDAVAIAFTGVDHRIDLGIVEIERADGDTEEHVFLVVAGLGLDAKMIKNTNSKLKKAVGWLAYIDGGLRSLPELHSIRIRYRLDGATERSMNVHTIMVGNCGALPGGILLMPDAKPDDGILDIAALRPRGPFGWVKVWNKVAWENGVLRKSVIGRKIIDLSSPDVKSVTYFTGRTLDIVVESPQEFQLDGDEFGEATSVRTRVDAGALAVRMPT
ncbi:MAG: diacylglycerol kinase family protein [Rhodoglobus sp.]